MVKGTVIRNAAAGAWSEDEEGESSGTESDPHAGRSELRAESLTKSYRRRCVVDHISLSLRQSEIVGLLGPNGAGKTTTFYMLVGMETPDQGRITFGTLDVTRMPMYLRARMGLSYLPQEPSIFRKLTVEQNLMAVLETLPLDRAERMRRLDQLLEELGISSVRRAMGYALSGGERRRTEIARALVLDPRFVLLDEPFAGIDPLAVLDIQRIIRHLKARGIGVLVTDHNVRDTLEITDRAYIINEGVIFRSGTPDALAADADVRRVYLGENFRL